MLSGWRPEAQKLSDETKAMHLGRGRILEDSGLQIPCFSYRAVLLSTLQLI